MKLDGVLVLCKLSAVKDPRGPYTYRSHQFLDSDWCGYLPWSVHNDFGTGVSDLGDRLHGRRDQLQKRSSEDDGYVQPVTIGIIDKTE